MLHECMYVDNRHWIPPVVAHTVTSTEFPIIDFADWEFLFQLLFLRKRSSPRSLFVVRTLPPPPKLLSVKQELRNAAGQRRHEKTATPISMTALIAPV